MKLQIKNAKLWKTGSGSAVITIPSDYIKNEQLKIGEEYDIDIDIPEVNV